MKIFKLSQSTDSLPQEERRRYAKVYNSFLDAIGGNRFKSGRDFSDYTELSFDDHGGYYIQVSLNKDTLKIRIEIYYEREVLQDEYGKIITIPFRSDDLQRMIDETKRVIVKLQQMV